MKYLQFPSGIPYLGFVVALFLAACATPMGPISSSGIAPLGPVIDECKKAIDRYQAVEGKDALQLKAADFTFKTTTDKKISGSLGYYVLKAGVSVDESRTRNFTFSYAQPSTRALSLRRPPKEDFYTQLVDAIEAAANALKNTPHTIGNVPFSQLKVELDFGVTWTGDLGVNVPYLVTIGADFAATKASTQSVTLTFAQPSTSSSPAPKPSPEKPADE